MLPRNLFPKSRLPPTTGAHPAAASVAGPQMASRRELLWPQGAVVSLLLSNIYLDPLDHLMAERGFEVVRYADDFVVMCRTLEEATAALALVKRSEERRVGKECA